MERFDFRETMSQETENRLKAHFGRSFSQRRLQSAESDVNGYIEQDNSNLRRYVEQKRKKEREMDKHNRMRKPKEYER